ncbi:MAG: Bax inhibitor-1/YccA family protein [Candidatus Paceibacterota bacterium]
MIRTSNPILNDRIFAETRSYSPAEIMTLEGTVNKTAICLALTIASAYYSYSHPGLAVLSLPAAILAFIIAIVITFKRTWATFLTPIYAIVKGVFVGAFSLFANNYVMQINPASSGVVFQAIVLTFGTLFALLMAYKSGYIKVTENFKLGIVAATGGIALFYLVSMIASLFVANLSFMYSSSPLSIGISVVVVIIAALNLVLDFDFIESAVASKNTPKYMEWFAAFGLLVTLIWLYLEILRLLMKLATSRE